VSARTERKCLGGLPMRGSPLSKIDRGKIGKVSAGNDVQRRQMIPVALRTGVVGREHAGIAEAVIHLAKKSGASEDIVMGVVGIGAEPVALSFFGVGLRINIMRPIAPARAVMGRPSSTVSQTLSNCITARIPNSGIPSRWEASVMNGCQRLTALAATNTR
jgi:hypothetical protein